MTKCRTAAGIYTFYTRWAPRSGACAIWGESVYIGDGICEHENFLVKCLEYLLAPCELLVPGFRLHACMTLQERIANGLLAARFRSLRCT